MLYIVEVPIPIYNIILCVIRNFDLRLMFRRVRTLTMMCSAKEADINFLVEKPKGPPGENII